MEAERRRPKATDVPVLLNTAKRPVTPRMTEDALRRTLVTLSVFLGIMFLLQIATIATLAGVIYELHDEESRILNNAMLVFRDKIYPDVLQVAQKKAVHAGCAARTLEQSLQCLCTQILVDNFGFSPALCDINGPCGFGGVDALVETCELDHVLEASSSDLSAFFTPAPDD